MAAVQGGSASEDKSPVVCVFCGSSPGKDPVHLESAQILAKSLHGAGYKLVYGGGTMGIMGEVAKTLVSLSGPSSVRGIIPRALIRTEVDSSIRHGTNSSKVERTMSPEELQRIDSNEDPDSKIVPANEFGATTIVPDMHTRKRMMAQCVEAGGPGSGFVALAGGYGTLEEVMEMVTWNQLGIHMIPIVLVNVNGYWTGLLDWVKNSIREGFVGEGAANILVEVKSADEVVEALRQYKLAPGRFKLDWSK
ncbi:hypothetical protein A1O3_08018 [Capronia epimyces CBS 606.96]|uniref:Lysine decarboxylase-like protein n=1 Tax=Capronia epimyces CBS 606.96 TaxID=1182542 RepID=W9XQW9_9EURO|nr:uncharacterized protein A1O3_08018 [Capronia epimyces CBS 606.96]EXJ79735.1 hypothetical protein A1O3_08018 [Capronia epimyces CBS 606.96]